MSVDVANGSILTRGGLVVRSFVLGCNPSLATYAGAESE